MTSATRRTVLKGRSAGAGGLVLDDLAPAYAGSISTECRIVPQGVRLRSFDCDRGRDPENRCFANAGLEDASPAFNRSPEKC